MFRKLLSSVLTVAMLVGLVPTSALAAHTNEGAESDGLGSAQIFINPAPADADDEALTPASELPNYSATLGPSVGDDIYPYTIQIQEGQTAADFYAEARVQMNLSVATTLANNDTLDVVKTRFLIFMAVSENIDVDTQTDWLFNSTFLTPDEDVLTSYGVAVRRATDDEYSSSYVSETGTAIDMGWVMSGDLNKLIIPKQDQVDTATTTGTFDFGPYFDDENCYVDDGDGTLELGNRVNTAFGPVLGIGTEEDLNGYYYLHNMNIYAIPVEMNWEAVRDAIANGSIQSNCKNPSEIDENSAAGGSLYADFTAADFMAPMELTALNIPDKGLKMTVDFTSLKPSYRAENSEEVSTRDNWFVDKQYLVDQFIPTTSDKDDYGTDWIHYVDAIPVSGVIGGAVYAYQSADAGESGLILGRYGTDAIDAGTILVQFTKPVTGDIKVEKTIQVQDDVTLTDDQKAALADLSHTPLGITVTNADGDEVADSNTLTLSWDETAQTLTATGTITGLASDTTYDVSVDAESTAALEAVGLYLQGDIQISGGEDIDLTDYYQLTRNEDGTVNTNGLIDEDKVPTVTVTSTYGKEKPVAPTVTLTYEANGGVGIPVREDYELEKPATIHSATEVNFTRTGYTFTGWNTHIDGSGTSYQPGTMLTMTEDTTLYAQWKAEGEEPPVETSDTVLSKTLSGNLDENGETNVTLSIPSDGYKQTVDVVLAVDCTSYLENAGSSVIRNIGEMADTLLEKNVHLNVGAVAFGNDAAVVSEITALNKGNSDSWASEVAAKIWDENLWEDKNSGTNIQLGVRTARELLDRSTSGADENHQYIVLITDGGGFWYCDEEGNSVNQYFSHGSTISEMVNMDANETSVCGEERLTVSTYSKYSEESDEHTFGTFLKDHGDAIEASAAGSISKAEAQAAAADPELMAQLAARAPTAAEIQSFDTYPYTNIERGVYYAAKELLEAKDDGVHIVTVGYPYYAAHDNVVLDTLSQEFLAWTGEIGTHYDGNNLGNAFSDLADQITYFVDAGSYVIDQMGSGTDDGWSYDFDFVNDAQYLTLTVGGETRTVTSLGENSYGFGEPNGSTYPFVLTYTPEADGKDDSFRLDINVPVLASEPVQLTYRVKQVNEEDGNTHGQYDPDGSQNSTGLFTNSNATLCPKDGPAMEFPKPTVSVGAIRIQPADITIYTGGDGYESVVTGSGNDLGGTNNGLPEPGFYITLPAEVNEWLLKNANEKDIVINDQGHEVVDLSEYLTFAYDDGKGTTRTWELERYDTNDNDNNSMAYEKFIYRIKPAVVNDEEIPIRLQFTNEDGSYTNSDDFTVSLDQLYQDYEMTIYAGDLNQGLVKAVLTVGNEKKEFSSAVDTGLLKIRGVNDEDPINEVNTGAPTSEVNEITAYVPEDANFYINSSKLEVANPDDVALLVDSIVPDENNTLYHSAVDKFAEITSSQNYQLQYMDLVDTSNGNAYVTTDKAVDIYWPYPEGTDRNTEFYVVHYQGMDREDEGALGSGSYEDEMVLYSEDNGKLETTDHGIKFTVESFSPFALFWGESGDPDWPPVDPDPDPDPDPNPDPDPGDKPELNTEDHYAYIVGYPDGNVKPEGNITRAEVATIFFRLLTDESRDEFWSQTNPYSDVSEDDWYNNAVSTLTNAGIIDGYEDGTFKPNGNITRAEFATIAVRFFEATYEGENLFPDIDGHWAQDYINEAANAGIVDGYPDGTFQPQQLITRAEAMTMVNRTIDRHPHEDHLLDDMIVWPDNPETAWYYEQVQEATNSHEYTMNTDDEQNPYEIWTELLPVRDWAQLEKEWSDAHSGQSGGDVV